MGSSIHADPPPPIVTEPTGINYATGGALGKGGFAICHRAERYEGSRPTGCMVALKIVKSKMEPAKLAQKFVTELQIHSKVSHPNIVTFYRAFSFQANTYVVLQLCSNGSLADMLKKRKCLTLPEIRRFVIQICGAVKYLHQRHIVHRDLKTGNLFLDDKMNIKVGDFGLAALLVTEKEMETKRRTTMCGTPNYLAPEILEKGKGHNQAVDLWSIGVIAYTLAVGKAPFHASSKEEIYKKLKQGEYRWPEISATTNDISADLRDTVASLLVEEHLRPSPDEIVTQKFFSIAYVPSSIPSSARERAPTWPNNVLPSAEVRQRGWSDSWYKACEHSGVGFKSDRKTFRLSNGSQRVRSIVHDMALEAQLGTVPTVPIPADVVYSSMGSDWAISESPEPEEIEDSRALKEISHNEVAQTRPQTVRRRDAEAMPPPPRPTSRNARTVSIRKSARTISEETAKSAEAVKVAADAPSTGVFTTALSNAAPTLRERSNTVASSRVNTVDDAAKLARSQSTRRQADASLARRPKTAVRRIERPQSPKEDKYATLEEMKYSTTRQRSRTKEARTNVVEVLSDEEETKPLAPVLHLSAAPKMDRSLPQPRKVSAPRISGLVSSDPTSVLCRLITLRDNLASALENAQNSQRRSARSVDVKSEELPFVSRWVDYSRKHGVGYVLDDGTVGCIINASAKSNTPVTHVVVKNGQKWLGRVGRNSENLDKVPIEIFEDKDDAGIVQIQDRSSSRGDTVDSIEANRRRSLSVLWLKFGRYMCQSLDGEERAGASKEQQFVRFYQRIGSVGVWAFLDGCLQIHFPDHTKLVLSADGTQLSATCITPEAAEYLAQHGELLPQHVATREVLSGSVQGLLQDSSRLRSRTCKANRIAEKLSFVHEIVTQWIENGGLGRMGEENGDEKLYWDGPNVKDGGRKTDRVTVGRCGGDLVARAVA